MNTAYRSRVALPYPSPYQVMKKQASDISDKNHPVRAEIQKCICTIDLTAQFEEDIKTVEMLKNVSSGIIGFICTLRRGDKIISVGRGTAIVNNANKFIQRSVHLAFNSSLTDAIARTKILDALHSDVNYPSQAIGMANETDGISEKQKDLLTSLIYQRIDNENERERRLQEIQSYSRDDASEMISSFLTASQR